MRNKHVHNQKGLIYKYDKGNFKSIREYKRTSIATPVLVSLEVVIECIIPFLIVLVNEIKSGCELNLIIKYGIILFIMAVLSLLFEL